MSIGSRIKDARIRKNLTQRELASLVGVTNGAIANYEAGTSSPKEPVMFKLLEVLGVDANYLFQDGYENHVEDPVVLTLREQRLISRYRSLDDSGKSFVEAVTEREYNRVTSSYALGSVSTLAAHSEGASLEEQLDAAAKLLAAHPELGD